MSIAVRYVGAICIALCGFSIASAGGLYCPQFLARDLKMLSRGQDVKELQLFLNSQPETIVAPAGIGSPGNETELFGYATADAVKRFQNKYGLLATGYLGFSERLTITLLCPKQNKNSQEVSADIKTTTTLNENLIEENIKEQETYIATVTPIVYVSNTQHDTSNNLTVSIPSSTNILASYSVQPNGGLALASGTDAPQYQVVLKEVYSRIPPDVLINDFENFVITNIVPPETPDIIAAVTPLANGKFNFTIYLDTYLRHVPSERALTIAHELAHVMAMNPSQHTYETPCSTYIDLNDYCYQKAGILNQFYERFWKGLSDNQIFVDSKYITEYAATNASEDFAETFAYFVLKDVYNFPQLSPYRLLQSPKVAEKLNFFTLWQSANELKEKFLRQF